MLDDNCNGSNVIHVLPSTSPPPPVVEVRRIKHREGDLLVLMCPFCKRKHMHGAGSKADCGDHGHRASHCISGPWRPNRGYILVEPCPPATAAKPKTARAPRPRGKRALRDFRRESDPHVRAALFRRLLVQHGFTHTGGRHHRPRPRRGRCVQDLYQRTAPAMTRRKESSPRIRSPDLVENRAMGKFPTGTIIEPVRNFRTGTTRN
jgi:hypothetical protein